jgi:hypothetical protein
VKKIITHINPDLDAVTAVWLIKRFLPGWEEAEVGFAQASLSTERVAGVDDNPDLLYVDVGRGKLDHHQTGEYLSAAKLCWEYILKNRKGEKFSELDQKALERLVEVVTEVDNARDLNWEEAGKDRDRFYLHNLLDGLRGLAASDQEVMGVGLKMLEAVLGNLKARVRAEEELKKGEEFTTPWGKGIAMETGNKQALWEGEVRGYVLVVIKDPETGGVRIHALPSSEVDLGDVYDKIRKLDPQSDWFLHASKKMLLNQASVVQMQPTKLSLEEIIGIFITK